ncbi:MAG: signal peptidase I [Solirubrobacterales bacterium]
MKFPLKPRGRLGGLIELAVIIALALSLAFAVQAWAVKPYQIPSGSMEPTLDIGQRVLVNRFVYRFTNPQIGDIVVFHPPASADQAGEECGVRVNGREPEEVGESCPKPSDHSSEQTFIKRIVALPGDTFSVKEGHPVVNGVEKRNEPYITPCGSAPACNLAKTIRIPPGEYFMMGDNRGNSDDSRFWGPSPRSWIIGEAFATYWPPDRVGLL